MTHVIQPGVTITFISRSDREGTGDPDGHQEDKARILRHILYRQEAQQEAEVEEGCESATCSSRDK